MAKRTVKTDPQQITAQVRLVNKKTESAVYSFIQAIRALGRDQVNTAEIADALSLNILTVNHAISALRKKGVKVLNA